MDRILDGSIGRRDVLKDKMKDHTFNIPCAFDIETTSYRDARGNKCATMYIWQFGINGYVFLGRTWEELLTLLGRIREKLHLSEHRYLIVYVHNLSFEFQFIRKWFQWSKVFSMETRKPIYARTVDGFEFRCSYLLSGYSLRKVSEGLKKYPVRKLSGDLDYKLIRHSQTDLTERETLYCINDVLVVMAYVQELIEREGTILKIPLTKTGFVRRYCREACLPSGSEKKTKFKKLRFRGLIKGLTLSPEEYTELKQAFQGGFTHASPFYSGKIVDDVTSYDFTSSYPTVMVSEMFPMSSSEEIPDIDAETFFRSLDRYCCLFEVTFVGLQPKILFDNYISVSRCRNTHGVIVQNGRVVSAEELTTTITETDFKIIREFYTWDDMFVSKFRRYRKGYLPKDFVLAILELYRQKTELKGIEGKEVEYLHGKEMLNSCYGMAVTDIVRSEIVYEDDWIGEQPADVEKTISHYNGDPKRFLFYPWGVWVTAYARRNLFTGILEFGEDYIYSDTDSVKVRRSEAHRAYIEAYNRMITESLERACRFHGIDPALTRPKTIHGEEKPLGVWDFDGHYKRFKTLGAKRYFVEYDDGHHSITVSGLNKKTAVPYLEDCAAEAGRDVFSLFAEGMHIPKGFTGGNVHTYIDEPFTGTLVDYDGVVGRVEERSCVHLEEDEYTMEISREYIDYIMSIR